MDALLQDYFASVEVFAEESDWTPTQQEIDTMKAFLSLKLPVAEAARSLTRRTSQSIELFPMKIRKSMLWSFINQTAVDLPSAQPLILELLKTIRTLDPKEGLSGNESDSICPADAWSTLEGWHNKWGDSINCYEGAHLCPASKLAEAEGAKWPQVIAYSARLMASGDPMIACLFFIRRSSTCIIRALDVDGILEDPRYQADIIAAAQLFVLSSRELLERCEAGDLIDGTDERNIQGTALWKQNMLKLSVQRWQHWKVRWQEIRDTSGVNEEIKMVSIKSLEAMETV